MNERAPKSLTRKELALLEKYKEERAKRFRADGRAQYAQTEGELARYVVDPNVKEPLERDLIDEAIDVVVVGGGWAGLASAVKLLQEGIDSFRIIETAGDFGGCWYWNRYPGCACDLDSYSYLPFLEDLGYFPSEKYAKQPEIFRHAQAIGKHFGLYRHALFQTQVTGVVWSEPDARWVIRTNRGDTFKARFVIVGAGPLNHPKLPGIPGIETFQGRSFHTSRWDYGYTGGDSTGDLTGLEDKRVAIIGNGSTGIQAAPHLAASARQLYVVQRTPVAVLPRGNKLLDLEWAKTQTPGWQRRRRECYDGQLAGVYDGENIVDEDVWMDIWVPPPSPGEGANSDEIRAAALHFDIEKMEKARARIDAIVKDPGTADALKPYYGRFCKRPNFSDEYLEMFNQPNVTLINTDGRGLERITERAIVHDGKSYDVDCIIFATGFAIYEMSHKANGFAIVGRGGVRLSDKWQKAIRTLHGMSTHGFPNLFFCAGPWQAATTVNYPFMMEEQAGHIANVIRQLIDRNVVTAEVTQQAEDRWRDVIRAKSKYDLEYDRACTPSYYNNEGEADTIETQVFALLYGGGPFEYMDVLRQWREGGIDQDMALTSEAA